MKAGSMPLGLATKVPPISLDPTRSPDLLNVLRRDGAMVRRGGVVPLFRDMLRGDCVRNIPWRTKGSIRNGSSNYEQAVSPGSLVAGHRPIYDDQAGLRIALWVRLDELLGQIIGNGQDSGGSEPFSWTTAPYTVRVCPIISKGPTKRTADTSGAWVTAAAQVWGTRTNDGMPFCLYVANTGTGTSPTWVWRLSAHVLVGGSWTLQTVTSSVPVEVGVRFHILAEVGAERLALRIKPIRGEQDTVYTEDEVTFAGTLATSQAPIMVFDCPQQFVEATTVGSASQRPGLGYTDGGIWWNMLRPAASVDDISIWSEDHDLEDLERSSKVVWDGQQGLINSWPMLDVEGSDYVLEATGRGNHLLMLPRGPVSLPEGREGGCWAFNGRTSYALLDTDKASWRYYNTTLKGALFSNVVNNEAHGIAVEFWLDAIEPQHEQVIAEIHSVLRLVVLPNGTLRGYCRDNGNGGLNYQGNVTSTTVLVPGRRYHVALIRRTGGTEMRLYVDGQLETSQTGLNAIGATGNHPPGGITVGIGSYARMIRASSATDTAILGSNVVHTDHRSGLVGRVETFRIIGGDESYSQIKQHDPEGLDDWRFADSPLFRLLAASATLQSLDKDSLRIASPGTMARPRAEEAQGDRIVHSVDTTSTTGQFYQLNDITVRTNPPIDQLGTDQPLQGSAVDILHTFAYYRFNEGDDDRIEAGAYLRQVEAVYDSAAPTNSYQWHPTKRVHIQLSNVTDAVGNLGAAQRRCCEPDVSYEATSGLFTGGQIPEGWTSRNRPYMVKHPRAVGVTWGESIAVAPTGQTKVTLVKSWDTQRGDRVMVVASGRRMHWIKPTWLDGSLLIWGDRSSYCRALTSSVNLAGPVAGPRTVHREVSIWLKPFRLSGQRMVLTARDASGAGVDQPSWMIYTDNGAVCVAGASDDGVNELVWRFVEGRSATTSVIKHNTLQVGRWNHLVVRMGASTVEAWVNGQLLSLVDTSTLSGAEQTSTYTAGAPMASTGILLGGSPEAREVISLANGVGSTVVVDSRSWWGQIADLAIFGSALTSFPSGQNGWTFARGDTISGTPIHRWLMSEGSGYIFTDSAALDADMESLVREVFPLDGAYRQEADRHYRCVAYRDSLIATNGAEVPLQVRWNGYWASKTMEVAPLGIPAPYAPTATATITAGVAGSTVPAGQYLAYVTFVDDEGNESDPTLLIDYTLASGVTELGWVIDDLPISTHPRVVARRLYLSGPGGGVPLFNRDIADNESTAVWIEVYSASGGMPTAGEQLPAPRARHIAVAGSSLILADLPDEPSGQNVFAISRPDLAGAFTISSTVNLDSEDGKAIVGIGHSLGQVYISKRDSIHQVGVGAIVTASALQASLRLVQPSDGIGGGLAPNSNRLIGAGDRGVFLSNGTDLSYLSDEIEKTWREQVDSTDLGLYRQFGAWWRPYSSYLLSFRTRGQSANTDVFVFDLSGGQAVWSLLRVPEHSYMGTVDRDGAQEIVFGTTSGRVMVYDEGLQIDGVDDTRSFYGDLVLEEDVPAELVTATTTSLSPANALFPVGLGGLVGVPVKIVHDGITEYRTIRNNTLGTIEWDEPLTGTTITSFEIGSYDGYWTSPWLGDGAPSGEDRLRGIHLQMIPQAGDLDLDVASIQISEAPERAFPALYERSAVSMASGRTQRPVMPREHAHNVYRRIRVGTSGANKPFGLISYYLDLSRGSSRDQTGRLS